MRVANIFAGAVTTLWLALFLLGRDLTRGVYLQGPGIGPNAGQIDYYIVYPMVAVALIILAGWAGNIFRKPLITLIPSFLIGFAIFPFLLGYTGGM
jgi:hypothetical protein